MKLLRGHAIIHLHLSPASILIATLPISPTCEHAMEQSSYRQRAERCRRLARSLTDPEASARLLELAAEYEAKANAEEENSKPRASD